MAAVYYILICFVAGYFLLKKLMPSFFCINEYSGLLEKKVKIPGWLVIFPASFLIGTLVLTWLTYLVAYLTRNTGKPMYYGTLTVLLLATAVVAVMIIAESVKKRWTGLRNTLFDGSTYVEKALVLGLLLVSVFLMFFTFFVKKGSVFIGLSVFSDFGPHMAMIRSFSHGSNFPTEYPFFPDGTVKYHFMFQFLAGILEYLGLRLDFAFNLPSILTFMAFLMLLFTLAVIVTGKKAAGILTCILFFFRSSFAFYTYLKDLISGNLSFKQIIAAILSNDEFIGKTPNESWGLWNQNVFANQRHLAFALGIMTIILIYVYPLYKKAHMNSIDSIDTGNDKDLKTNNNIFYRLFVSKDAWRPQNITSCIFLGFSLGLLSFWNGAVVFAILPILFVLAIASAHKLEYFIIAVLTVVISYIETNFFTGSASEVVKPVITLGFIAVNKSAAGIAAYLVELLGILPFVIIAALAIKPDKGIRWLCLAFLAPMIFAFTVQLTPDLNVNHKYVIISVLLLNIIAADLLVKLSRHRFTSVLAVLLAIALTLTGIIDIITVYNRNNINNINGKRPFVLNLNDPLTKWVEDNTDPNDVFLSDTYFIHPLLISGRKIFLGWPYFSWSAGYNTDDRGNVAKELFSSKSKDELVKLTEENGIAYIIVDGGLRNSDVYKVNEQLIASVYPAVYNDKDSKTVIYKTK